ncbi:hypothetical protein BA195_10115 [Tenacibaculum soleae]|uniref:Transcriptional regulator n=1 Tax=Tenacibaculum soleae TaxID=447689 RepID=A0A1B9XYK6_9FLAO|nr:hypothetical protein [Tenacibaculum soleae]OCK42521.1 hypothetical protein BA195_10115 [Tenacibaculum soleae]
MTLYQLINTPENLGVIVKLVKNKILVDSTVLHHLSIYDKYYELEGTKTERYKLLSKEFKKHPKTIQKIIKKLNQNAR